MSSVLSQYCRFFKQPPPRAPLLHLVCPPQPRYIFDDSPVCVHIICGMREECAEGLRAACSFDETSLLTDVARPLSVSAHTSCSVLFFNRDELRKRREEAAAPLSLARSLTHSLSHSHTPHSLTLFLTHSLIHSLTQSLSCALLLALPLARSLEDSLARSPVAHSPAPSRLFSHALSPPALSQLHTHLPSLLRTVHYLTL
eukprot:535933-Pleurochrysis_carterae.AAC.2